MLPESEQVLERIVALVRRLPAATLDRVCASLECGEVAPIAEPTARAEVALLLGAWRRLHPEDPGTGLAWSLRGAGAVERQRRDGASVELAWTGPAPAAGVLRRTDQALREVIESARDEVWILSFAAYRVPEVVRDLVAAARRGVRITMVLESREESDGNLTHSAIGGLGTEVAAAARVLVWPREKRKLGASGRPGSLHAKAALADDRLLFVSSANLTEYAMQLNMELGLLVRGGPAPEAFAEHLRWLVAVGELVRADQTQSPRA